MKTLLLPLLLIWAAAPAAAQERTASSPQALRELHAFARCAVEQRPVSAREMLSRDFRTRAYTRALRDLVDGTSLRCMGGSMSGGSVLFAGAVAEAAIARDLRGRSLGAATAYDPARPALQARNSAEYMVFCVLRTEPQRVASLFSTPAGSAEESVAIQAIRPMLPNCMPQGQMGQFNNSGLRAIFATGAYRLMQHNNAPAGASGN